MFNNAYQNLELKIDLLSGGTIAGLKEKIKSILENKILILCGLKLDGVAKLPAVCEPKIYVTQTEEPDDWDEEEDGEFVPEDVYHLEASNVYGYDIAIEDNVVTCAKTSSSVDILSVNEITSEEDEISAQKPVVEVMTGYSAEETDSSDRANLTTEPLYFGAVKNGNKLTLVYALKVTRTGVVSIENRLLRVTIPEEVGAKIYPVTIAGYAKLVDLKPLAAAYSYRYANMDSMGMISKESNTLLEFWLINPSTYTENVEHYIRIEATLLLSDNLFE